MGGTTKKKQKSKPTKLTELFSTSSQSSNPNKELTYPSSPTPSSHPESLESEQLEVAGPVPSTEQNLQKLFHSFREDFQVDFRHMMTELKMEFQSLVARTEHIEHKIMDFAKSHNQPIDSHSALKEEVLRLSTKVLDLEDRSRRNNIRM